MMHWKWETITNCVMGSLGIVGVVYLLAMVASCERDRMANAPATIIVPHGADGVRVEWEIPRTEGK